MNLKQRISKQKQCPDCNRSTLVTIYAGVSSVPVGAECKHCGWSNLEAKEEEE